MSQKPTLAGWAVVSLIGALAIGCYGSATRPTDGGGPDVGPTEAGASMDAGAVVDGDGAQPQLLALTQEGRDAVLTTFDARGEARQVLRVALRENEQARALSVETVSGPVFLFSTVPATDWRDGGRARQIDLEAGTAVEWTNPLQEEPLPDSRCARYDGRLRARYFEAPDGRFALIECELEESSPGFAPPTELYLERPDGTLVRVAPGCARLRFFADEGRALIDVRPTCGDTSSLHVLDMATGALAPADWFEPDDRIHFWHPARGAWLVSTETLSDSAFLFHDTRFVSADGVRGPVLRETYPEAPLLLAMSGDSEIVVVAIRPPGDGVVTSIELQRLDSGEVTPAAVGPCTNVLGIPFDLAWAPDDSAFAYDCWEGTFLVRRNGSAWLLAAETTRDRIQGIEWSPDSRLLLRRRVPDSRVDETEWDLIESHTGAPRPAPPGLNALEPIDVIWSPLDR